VFAADGGPVAHDVLVRMTRTLVHRGPDDEGYYHAAGIGLGHRRLSIIDLTAGHQPLANEDETIWVAFNGEIFNYRELRIELARQGHRLRTASDTETIVHLYEQYGLDFVDHLNGQFAIALWDGPRRRLVLARDRVGIRPLFYANLPNGDLLFASEAKAILAHGAVRAEVDPTALAQLSTFWVTVPPRTQFKGICELPPGSLLVVEPARQSLVQYWKHQFPDVDGYADRPIQYWTELTREALSRSIELQLRADVPVATYLSGGLDSSIISALVRRDHNHALKTFSLAFADAAFDERTFQQRMAQHLGTEHFSIAVDHDAIGREFSDAVRFAERPLLRTAPAPLISLAGLVRDNGIKVVLTGEGADEVFGGYDIFREDKIRRFWARSPNSAWRPLALSRLNAFVKRDVKADAFWRAFFRKGLERVDDPYYSHRIRWDNGAHLRRVFHADLRAQMPAESEVFEDLGSYLDRDRDRWHPLCRAQYLEFTLFMSGYLLSAQGDRTMMSRSIEGRVPFLDHHVIEAGALIPPKFKIRGLNEKHVLKRAFADLLPAEIAARPKMPYRAPIAACFRSPEQNLAARLIEPSSIARTGMLDAAVVDKLFGKARSSTGVSEREDMSIALAVSTQLFHHHFLDDQSGSSYAHHGEQVYA
jgi:asparagine synthase (glutamine-hydrolysing)